jgi:hypothetical protein
MSAPEDKPTSDDVEAHRKRFFKSEDAEAPEDLGEISKDEASEDEDDEPDVEAHRKRFF